MDRLKILLGDDEPWLEPPGVQMPDPSYINTTPSEPVYLSWESVSQDDGKIIGSSSLKKNKEQVLLEARAIVGFPSYPLDIAELAPEGELFCHFDALIKFPYSHVSKDKDECDEVAEYFFSKNRIYEQVWDFFYIYPPRDTRGARKSILFVPSRQVEFFLKRINSQLTLELAMPKDAPGFNIDFANDGSPRPRYLGKSADHEDAKDLKDSVPSSSYRPHDEIDSEQPTNSSLAAFKKKIELLMEQDKKKKELQKGKKAAERHEKQQGWVRSIKRVQRYLGLREARSGHDAAIRAQLAGSDLLWTDHSEAVTVAAANMKKAKPFSFQRKPPFFQEDSVIFVCVDIESFERDHNKVTEIGIAYLDTADIKDLAPGPGFTTWKDAIYARHFRIRDYSHLVNKDFIHGCPEDFRFGDSEWISLEDAPQEIAKCFKEPFSKSESASTLLGKLNISKNSFEKRKMILVGHDLSNDIEYLRKIGYNPQNLSNLQEFIDTSNMYRALRREQNPRNLGGILADLDLAGWSLHNAGNDAVYTLQAMLGIALTDMVEREVDYDEKKEQQKLEKIASSVREALDRALESQQGWSSNEDSDGGAPVKPRLSSQAQHSTANRGDMNRGRGSYMDSSRGYRGHNARDRGSRSGDSRGAWGYSESVW